MTLNVHDQVNQNQLIKSIKSYQPGKSKKEREPREAKRKMALDSTSAGTGTKRMKQTDENDEHEQGLISSFLR